MLIVLTGPGAVGKDAVVNNMLKKYPNFQRVITTTSRIPRDWEKDGKDYYFVDSHNFETLIRNGKLLEYVNFAGNHYGTTKEALKPFIEGKDMIWKVEITRGAQVEQLITENYSNLADDLLKKIKVFYIDVPDWNILRERLQKRGLTHDDVEKRLEADKADWEKYKDKFKNIIMNIPGKLDITVEEIASAFTPGGWNSFTPLEQGA